MEDQPDNQALLTKLMAEIGVSTRLAENGAQAIAMFQEWHPHFIWMDRRMPVMDGVEATRLIRRLPGGNEVKIAAVTASALQEERQMMLEAGMDDFVRKPYRIEEIYDCLARHLGLKYLYRFGAPQAEAATSELPGERLAALPPALRQELQEAVESLDSERIAALIQRVRQTDEGLGEMLAAQAENFNYPVILRALMPRLRRDRLAS